MRECTSCSRTYWRRNKFELWTKRNPGSRGGWYKEESKLCMDCLKIPQMNRMMMVANVRFGKKVKKRRRA